MSNKLGCYSVINIFKGIQDDPPHRVKVMPILRNKHGLDCVCSEGAQTNPVIGCVRRECAQNNPVIGCDFSAWLVR